MDVGKLIVAMLGGALGGALGGLMIALAKRRGAAALGQALQVTAVVLAVLGGMLAPRAGGLVDWVNERLGRQSRLETMTMAGGRRLLEDTRYRALVAGKSPAEAMVIGAQMSARGIPFLDEPALDEWVRIRTLLAKRSPQVCAGLWTGALDPQTIQRALGELPEADMQAWVDLTIDASLRAVGNDGEAPADESAAIAGIEQIVAALPEAEREAVRADLGQQGLPMARACRLMTVVHDGVKSLPKDLKYRFLRALARG